MSKSSMAAAKAFVTSILAALVLQLPLGCAPRTELAPVFTEDSAEVIPGRYIVVFAADETTRYRGVSQGDLSTARSRSVSAQNLARKLGGDIRSEYTTALIGFSATLPPAALEALRSAPGVAYIEGVKLGFPTTIQPPNPPGVPALGLDRIDRRLLPLNDTYTYSETGTGVHAYVIDSGIRATHSEFEGRVSGGTSTIQGSPNDTDDCKGHGTQIAGVIGARTFGVAKNVQLHPVRVSGCDPQTDPADLVQGIDWVAANAIAPAVANISLGFSGPGELAVQDAVTNLVDSGVTTVVSAGNADWDACLLTPATVPNAITVGATDPNTDKRLLANDPPGVPASNWGTCVDWFAPGIVETTGHTDDNATIFAAGTSAAAPLVTGVAARYLDTHPFASPDQVRAAIHHANNIEMTAGWGGVAERGAGSPNELLHYGSLDDGYTDGDPHIKTVDGVRYDFQGAGEFVVLRDGNGLEIQARQAAVSTSGRILDHYVGIRNCVSINTAIAARVGQNRVTFQPGLSGAPDPSGLQLRVNGELVALSANGLHLTGGGHIESTPVGGIAVTFLDGTELLVTPRWWSGRQLWHLNVDVLRTPAVEGIMGAIASGSWLPAFPDGTSIGSMPASLHERHVDLNVKFTNAWRVSNESSLFDYAPGTSTATFTRPDWPPEDGRCEVPNSEAAPPIQQAVAEQLCAPLVDDDRRANCVADVMVTGERGFADVYLAAERVRRSSTRIAVYDDKDVTQRGQSVKFTAVVMRKSQRDKEPESRPVGVVNFEVDGKPVAEGVKLDEHGHAVWETARLWPGSHEVTARYVPFENSDLLSSVSPIQEHTVVKKFARVGARRPLDQKK